MTKDWNILIKKLSVMSEIRLNSFVSNLYIGIWYILHIHNLNMYVNVLILVLRSKSDIIVRYFHNLSTHCIGLLGCYDRVNMYDFCVWVPPWSTYKRPTYDPHSRKTSNGIKCRHKPFAVDVHGERSKWYFVLKFFR